MKQLYESFYTRKYSLTIVFSSVAFKYMFNACRIPHREMDGYRIYDPSLHKHCIVARKGVYFSFDFVDDEGNPLDIEQLEVNLMECIRLADAAKDTPKLGFLTSSDRDSWADAREEMITQGKENMVKALEKLESGALLLCLDEENPISRAECANIFWTGHHSSGHNRWFDKSIQLMVTENGKAGLIGEHSMMDGMPMIAFAHSITGSPYVEKVKSNARNYEANVKNIFSDCQSSLMAPSSLLPSMIEKSKVEFDKLISDHDLDVLSFQRYGSNHIKSMGYSPE
jgi:carnitine O-acetyltransferase